VFSALVRKIGVEDAGEIVALATTEQLVAAFDEDLFANTAPGEREVFDAERFAVWLQVLLEAGDAAAAQRLTELSEDFVIQSLSDIVMVLDHDALQASMSQGGEEAEYADKALENCLSEEIDGYLLISRQATGWDAALAVILALDRDHRAFLVRILDRCAHMASDYIEDLEGLASVLSAGESLAEDVEAEREERRSARGYVEPRAARSFLTLARRQLPASGAVPERDPVTRAYFRDLQRQSAPLKANDAEVEGRKVRGLLSAVDDFVQEQASPATSSQVPSRTARLTDDVACEQEELALVEAMRELANAQPRIYAQRVEEFAYLTNVLMAGAVHQHARFRAADAADAVLATTAYGAELIARESRAAKVASADPATTTELLHVLENYSADLLFRKASGTLSATTLRSPWSGTKSPAGSRGFLISRVEARSAIAELVERARSKARLTRARGPAA
jgi:hypothetical protein